MKLIMGKGLDAFQVSEEVGADQKSSGNRREAEVEQEWSVRWLRLGSGCGACCCFHAPLLKRGGVATSFVIGAEGGCCGVGKVDLFASAFAADVGSDAVYSRRSGFALWLFHKSATPPGRRCSAIISCEGQGRGVQARVTTPVRGPIPLLDSAEFLPALTLRVGDPIAPRYGARSGRHAAVVRPSQLPFYCMARRP